MKEYFSHDYYAREDEKIKNLFYAHQWLGYGLYWGLIESLYQNNGFMQLDYQRIAFDMRTDSVIIDSIINSFDLFKIDGNKFYSESVLRRLEERKIKSNKAKENAEIRWGKGKEGSNETDANALQTECDGNTIKEKKRKEKEIKEYNIDIIYKLYPSTCPISNRSTGKCNKNKISIGKLLDSNINLESIIPKYVSECIKTKTYIKNFGTFLNQIPDYSENNEPVTTKKKFRVKHPMGESKTYEVETLQQAKELYQQNTGVLNIDEIYQVDGN